MGCEVRRKKTKGKVGMPCPYCTEQRRGEICGWGKGRGGWIVLLGVEEDTRESSENSVFTTIFRKAGGGGESGTETGLAPSITVGSQYTEGAEISNSIWFRSMEVTAKGSLNRNAWSLSQGSRTMGGRGWGQWLVFHYVWYYLILNHLHTLLIKIFNKELLR